MDLTLLPSLYVQRRFLLIIGTPRASSFHGMGAKLI